MPRNGPSTRVPDEKPHDNQSRAKHHRIEEAFEHPVRNKQRRPRDKHETEKQTSFPCVARLPERPQGVAKRDLLRHGEGLAKGLAKVTDDSRRCDADDDASGER
jgi:hypothetical protein